MSSTAPSLSIAFFVFTACTALAGLYLLYHAALPRPLPGIPYRKQSAVRLLGDLPDAIRFQKQTNELLAYFDVFARELDSPVVQFLRPLGRPWVLVSDYRETRDILTRRTREFDRAKFFADTVRPLLPKFHVVMETGEEWKAHRQLLAETMSTEFLHNTVAPEIENTVQRLISLWTEKARLAYRHPFNVQMDIVKELTEAIWTATWGSDSGSTKAQLDLLANLDEITLTNDPDIPTVFPETKDPEAFTAIRTLTNSLSIPLTAPAFPSFVYKVALKFVPGLVRAQKEARALVTTRLKAVKERISDTKSMEKGQAHERPKSALDLLVAKEIAMAKKADRLPTVYSQAIQDELLGFMMAGSDTTAAVMLWCVKYLTANQSMQSRLRAALHGHFGDSGPSAKTLSGAEIPYLDAFIAETQRLSASSPVITRMSIVDTDILGYPIPKDTDIFFLLNGPGFITPAIAVEDQKRSKSSRDDNLHNVAWDVKGINVFEPSRWLMKKADGTEVFNAYAGPSLPFSAGPRGCFGSKLAQMSLKIHVALIVWNFELQSLPAGISTMSAGHDRITRQPEDCYLRLKKL